MITRTIACRNHQSFSYPVANTALIIIDMQRDFCCEGGYGAQSGGSVAPMRRIIPNVAALLEHGRRIGLTIIHTREGHLPDLSDCPPAKLARSRNADAEIGKMGPMGRLLIRGEYGHDFVDELTPATGEIVIDKPGFSAFHSTALDTILRNRQISHLILTGVTTDVCVHSTLRSAVDRGFYCLTIEDATASFEEAIQTACIDMIAVEGGIFGQVATTEAMLAA